MGWDGPVLSDSGGFQVWSLIRQDPSRGVIRDREVIFREPETGEKWNLTPERVIACSSSWAATSRSAWTTAPMPTRPAAEQERSVERTVAWARRSREAFDRLAAGTARGRDAAAALRGRAGRRRGEAAPSVRAALAGIGFDGYGFGGWPLAADGSLLSRPAALGGGVVAGIGAQATRWGSAGRTTW